MSCKWSKSVATVDYLHNSAHFAENLIPSMGRSSDCSNFTLNHLILSPWKWERHCMTFYYTCTCTLKTLWPKGESSEASRRKVTAWSKAEHHLGAIWQFYTNRQAPKPTGQQHSSQATDQEQATYITNFDINVHLCVKVSILVWKFSLD